MQMNQFCVILNIIFIIYYLTKGEKKHFAVQHFVYRIPNEAHKEKNDCTYTFYDETRLLRHFRA